MDNIRPTDYAYPVAPGDVAYWQPGMTLRDYFAAQAMIGVISACANDTRQGGEAFEGMFARKAYSIADAMMKERNQ